ncbi:hypothetical protein LWI28_026861 [Acer negundo]|uniref:RNase H type-1 domain-containing protein n=1 Tax=Acer negundo TaxID=4023 RepID=A0AAD5IJQ7_ACENE|nr:hypothetical protein LWI28_026861 [Acer negundo]
MSVNSQGGSLLWHYDKRGLFSVKSAYRLALAAMCENQPSCSMGLPGWWKRMWSLSFPGKRASGGSTVKKGNKDSNQTWVVPCLGSFKLNVDVALNTSNGRFGADLVFRNDRGSIVDAAAVRLNGSGSLEVAEAGAILKGFSLAVENGWFPLSIESDALGVVNL